ncbi:MAG: trypsin-like serine protease, partial [Prevotellaceae bacterium]|nr:trypsin-like serine protease [Prevotellaceae bacterium]
LKFCGNIQPIDYETCKDESLYVPETDAVVYGWGRIVPDAASNLLILRAVDVKIISQEKANRIYGASVVPNNTIVSVGKNSLGMGGKGDSGGPLVVFDEEQNPILVGVTALADTRSEAKNSGLTVYNKVKPVIEWIDNCKCEIIGIDTVSPFGTSFTIVNMPPGVKSVEWTYSGLIEINSTMDCTNVIPSEIEGEITGCVSAVITTNLGTITVCKELTIMPRIDVDINIRYNKNRSKYEMIAKTVNMKTIDNKDILKCKDVVDNVKLLGFIWTYDKEIAIGKEVIFDVDPNSSKTHTISVNRYDCDHTIRLEKTFVIHHKNNEFAIVHNEPGTITIGGMRMSIDIDTFEELQMTYIKNTVENNVLLNTSHITMENLNSFEKKLDKGNYKVSLYSRKGNLLYVNYFTNNTLPLQINTSEFYSDIYILHIHNLDTNNVMTRFLVVNQ